MCDERQCNAYTSKLRNDLFSENELQLTSLEDLIWGLIAWRLCLMFSNNEESSISFLRNDEEVRSILMLSTKKASNSVGHWSARNSVHGKEKYAVGPMDLLLRKAAGPQQKLPVHTLD